MKIDLSLVVPSYRAKRALQEGEFPFTGVAVEGPDKEGFYHFILHSILDVPPLAIVDHIVKCEIWDDFSQKPVRRHGVYTSKSGEIEARATVDEVQRDALLRRHIHVLVGPIRGHDNVIIPVTGISRAAIKLYASIRSGLINPTANESDWSGEQIAEPQAARPRSER